MEVINLNERRSPHASGEAFCLGCDHEWQAVVPVGTKIFQCPSCKAFKGRFKFDHVILNQLVYECQCGNQLMYKTPNGCYCPNCGLWDD